MEGALTGQTYVITGTLERWTREQAASELEARGAKVAGSVSKKTSGVIVGEEPGATKLNKAREVGVPILDEQALAKLLDENAAARAPAESLGPPTRFGR